MTLQLSRWPAPARATAGKAMILAQCTFELAGALASKSRQGACAKQCALLQWPVLSCTEAVAGPHKEESHLYSTARCSGHGPRWSCCSR